MFFSAYMSCSILESRAFTGFRLYNRFFYVPLYPIIESVEVIDLKSMSLFMFFCCGCSAIMDTRCARPVK